MTHTTATKFAALRKKAQGNIANQNIMFLLPFKRTVSFHFANALTSQDNISFKNCLEQQMFTWRARKVEETEVDGNNCRRSWKNVVRVLLDKSRVQLAELLTAIVCAVVACTLHQVAPP